LTVPVKLPGHIEDASGSGLEEGEKTFTEVEIAITTTTSRALFRGGSDPACGIYTKENETYQIHNGGMS